MRSGERFRGSDAVDRRLAQIRLLHLAHGIAREFGNNPDAARNLEAREAAGEGGKYGIAVSGGGSGTGISAMISGTVDIANASRKMEPDEVKAAELFNSAAEILVHPASPRRGSGCQHPG